jgi:hypothetical protein
MLRLVSSSAIARYGNSYHAPRRAPLNVQHEGIDIASQGRDNEWNALGHQARNEVNIASQQVQFRNNDGGDLSAWPCAARIGKPPNSADLTREKLFQ